MTSYCYVKHSGVAGNPSCADSDLITCRYALKVPASLPLVAAAPLLCAGITTYSPLKHYGLDKPGQKLGVVGLGGLGHMAVKFGKVCCQSLHSPIFWIAVRECALHA